MSKWANMSEVNNTLGKALESCKDELNPSFYAGARCVLDKINEMAEEVADAPLTQEERIREQCRAFIDIVKHTERSE